MSIESEEVQTPSQDDVFPLFPQLPADIRHEIWRAASSTPGSTPGVCIFTIATPAVATSTTYEPPKHAPPVVYEPVNSAVLTTSTEAYDIALQTKAGTRPYNPAIDIIYIPTDSFQHFMGDVAGLGGEPWVEDVRHIALSLPMSDYGSWLPIALMRLRSLETLSVVYPAASGLFDCHDEPHVPLDKNTWLRLLTGEERVNLTITADYRFETYGGNFPIRWTKNVNEHLQMIEKNLVGYASPEWNGGADASIPIWDPEHKTLKLKYQARVFEPLRLKSFRDQGKEPEEAAM